MLKPVSSLKSTFLTTDLLTISLDVYFRLAASIQDRAPIAKWHLFGFVNGCGCVCVSNGTAQMGFMSAPEGREMDGGLTRV